MPSYKKNGSISATPSLLSISSYMDVSFTEESLPNPTTYQDCNELLQNLQSIYDEKCNYRSNIIQQYRDLRAGKGPLLKRKEELHSKISQCDQAIKVNSGELVLIKHKLRYMSENLIQGNIERLEFQLRTTNYKAREEQKILDEISWLRKSSRALKDFHSKQRESKSLRSERSRLIQSRNDNYARICQILSEEEELKRVILEVKAVAKSTHKSIEHLETLLPELQKQYEEEQKKAEELKKALTKERERIKDEIFIKHKIERDKKRKESESNKEFYKEEKDLCKMVLAYLNSLATPLTDNQDIQTSSIPLNGIEKGPKYSSDTSNIPGNFYCKSSFDNEDLPKSKKDRTKMKKLQKSSKIRALSHTPDALTNLSKLQIDIPKTTADLQGCITSVENKLQHFINLAEMEKQVHQYNSSEMESKHDQKTGIVCNYLDLKSECNESESCTKELESLPSKIETENSELLTEKSGLVTGNSELVTENPVLFTEKSELVTRKSKLVLVKEESELHTQKQESLTEESELVTEKQESHSEKSDSFTKESELVLEEPELHTEIQESLAGESREYENHLQESELVAGEPEILKKQPENLSENSYFTTDKIESLIENKSSSRDECKHDSSKQKESSLLNNHLCSNEFNESQSVTMKSCVTDKQKIKTLNENL